MQSATVRTSVAGIPINKVTATCRTEARGLDIRGKAVDVNTIGSNRLKSGLCLPFFSEWEPFDTENTHWIH